MDSHASRTTVSYDAVVSDYSKKNRQLSSAFESFRLRFLDAVRTPRLIADLGCGPGRDAAWFNRVGATSIGVDISTLMLRYAKDSSVTVVKADIRVPPFNDKTFDGLWSSASLLHVSASETKQTFQQWGDMLKPRGVLGLSTLAGDSCGWEEMPYTTALTAPTSPRHRWVVRHSPDRIAEDLMECGFNVGSLDLDTSDRSWLTILAYKR
jgi:SAM-dependent methyltransferase